MHYSYTIYIHASVIKHTFRAPFSILNRVPYRIFRVDSEFNTPAAVGTLFGWIVDIFCHLFKSVFWTSLCHVWPHIFKKLFVNSFPPFSFKPVFEHYYTHTDTVPFIEFGLSSNLGVHFSFSPMSRISVSFMISYFL